MMRFDTALPIDDALPGLTAALEAGTRAVLVAPPGAGKTTRVPLALLDASWLNGQKIILLEPRRIAARASAERMAKTLGERLGETIGLRVRFGSKLSGKTRIEVVTEGIFARMILDDPSLEGIGAVLFDEYHERSLDADFGLALALDAQAGLRDDLRLLVMSATLDGARVAKLLDDAPVIESLGRSYPVETRYAPRDPSKRLEDDVAALILRALREEEGSLLAFLPGAGEIRRVETLLAERLRDTTTDLVTLYGALDPQAQDRAIAPSPPGRRKVVLATSIAETSLTIEGVRVIVDSGFARVPVYEPDLGLTRLDTVRVSRAAADQRRGRAGRTQPGVCYRLWLEAQEGSFPAYAAPEILAADLSTLLLDCAAWGVSDPLTLRWLDAPPAMALKEARALLLALALTDEQGRITALGKAVRRLPLPVRLGRMVHEAKALGEGELAALLAVVLGEKGLGGDDPDLAHRIDRLRRDNSRKASDAKRLARSFLDGAQEGTVDTSRTGALLALAYPDRIAKARGKEGDYVLVNGRGGSLDPASALAREPFLAVAELGGTAGRSRILAAAALALDEIEATQPVLTRDEVSYDAQAQALRARRVTRLGAIVLAESTLAVPNDEASARALAEAASARGLARLPWSKAQGSLRHRCTYLSRVDDSYPDLSDEALAPTAAEWLAPFLTGLTRLADINAEVLGAALDQLVPYALKKRIDEDLPSHFLAPSGQTHPIDYEGDEPTLAIRVQELFGLATHPSVARGKIPLTVELLSPAHRPVQVTRDLPGFWRGSYAAVKSEMKGRYPKHPWPDNPLEAPATHRAKPRGT